MASAETFLLLLWFKVLREKHATKTDPSGAMWCREKGVGLLWREIPPEVTPLPTIEAVRSTLTMHCRGCRGCVFGQR